MNVLIAALVGLALVGAAVVVYAATVGMWEWTRPRRERDPYEWAAIAAFAIAVGAFALGLLTGPM